MKKRLIASVLLGATLFTNTMVASAQQDITIPGSSGETNVTVAVDPTYTVSIPTGIDKNVPFSITGGKRTLSDFEVTAKDVVLPYNHAVQVAVQAKSDFRNNGKNAALNETGQYLDFYFERDSQEKYGLAEGASEGDPKGKYIVAQFRPVTDNLHTSNAPLKMITDDVLVTSGTYQSSLVFDISLVSLD